MFTESAALCMEMWDMPSARKKWLLPHTVNASTAAASIAVQWRLAVSLVHTSIAPLTTTFAGEFNTWNLCTRFCASITANNCTEVSLMTLLWSFNPLFVWFLSVYQECLWQIRLKQAGSFRFLLQINKTKHITWSKGKKNVVQPL